MKNFSLVYLTSRPDPKFEWFADGLCHQVGTTQFPDVVIVDTQLWSQGNNRRAQLADIVKGRFHYCHVCPKPNVFQSPHRLTKADFFCPSSARNTGIIYSKEDYVVFTDDLSIYRENWLNNVRHAVQEGYVVCGSYRKVRNLVVENGQLVKFDAHTTAEGKELGMDCRWGSGSDSGRVRTHWEHLFGCSFGVPMAAALACNGLDEMHDSMSGEDTQFGRQLTRMGHTLWFNRNMATYEDHDAHFQPGGMIRGDKKMPDQNPVSPILERVLGGNPVGQRFNPRLMGQFKGKSLLGPDASHVMKYLNEQRSGYASIGTTHDLAAVRKHVLAGGEIPVPTWPTLHWPDGQPLSEMAST